MATRHQERKARRSPFEKARGIERQYASRLRRIADHIGHIINGLGDPLTDPAALAAIDTAMSKYSDLLGPWAQSAAGKVIAALDRQDRDAWWAHSVQMSRGLREEIWNAPTGDTMRAMLAEQVGLIKSLPLDAAQRVHDLTIKGLEDGTRASEIAKMIGASGEVTRSRATLIARTEVARTSSKLTESRSLHVGIEEYIWRTARDEDVREAHRKMEGKVCQWAVTPTLSDGTHTHAGQIYNCRCYPEPIVPKF